MADASIAREALTIIVAKVEKQQAGKGLLRFMVETLLPFSSDGWERRFSGVADAELPKRLRRLDEGDLRGLVFELAMEQALLQTCAGYTKELTTACKLFGVNLKSVEAKMRKTMSEAER